jgi:hypothetical protein
VAIALVVAVTVLRGRPPAEVVHPVEFERADVGEQHLEGRVTSA